MNKQDVIDALRQGVVTVEFAKLNGEMRIMDCTLDEMVIPKPERPVVKEDATPRKKPETSLAVWDMDKHGWRSFRWDSITRVNNQPVSFVEDTAQ